MPDASKLITEDDLKQFRSTHKYNPMQHKQELIDFLNVVLENLPKKEEIIFMEIGLYTGGNFVFTGDMLSKFYPNVYGIGIDLPGIKEYAGGNVKPKKTIRDSNPEFGYDLILEDSKAQPTINAAKELLADRKIDLLFIDGDHSYEGCMSDVKNYVPMVTDGGIVGFHDLGENRFDIKTRVWPEIKAKYLQHHEFVYSPGRYGIGLIIKDKQ